MYSILKRAIFFILLIGFWELLSRCGIWPEYVLPSPISVYKTLIRGFQDQTFIIGIAISMKRISIGYGVAIVIGILLGLLIGRVRVFEETLGSLISGLQTLPTICWLPLALLWFGLNESAIVFVVVMGALLSITTATESGIKNAPPLLIKAGQNMGARGPRLL